MQVPANTASAAPSSQSRLARLVRQQFVQGWCAGLPGIDQTLAGFLDQLRSQTGTQRDMQAWNDAWTQFQQHRGDWLRGATLAGTQALLPMDSARADLLSGDAFELLGDEVVENRIVAARMALAVTEQVGAAFNALRLRLQSLEGQELPGNDILRPETLCLLLVEQWGKASLSRSDLAWVLEPLQRSLVTLLQGLYAKGNDFLAGQGVTAKQELRVRVKRRYWKLSPSSIPLISSGKQQRDAALYGCGRWCGYADHAQAVHACGACPDKFPDRSDV